MGKPAAGGLLLSLTPLGLLPRGAKIDDVAHVKLGGNQIIWLGPSRPRFVWNNYADMVAHGNSEPMTSPLEIAVWKCGYTPRVRQDTVA